MLYLSLLISIVEVLIVTVPVLLTVAFVTVAERKTMASMQRRLGPNIVGYYGLLQALSSPPKPHAFVSLPVQSSMNFRLISTISLFLLTVFFTLALRWPFKTIFGQLDMLAYYPFINTFLSLVLAFCMASASLKELSKSRIVFIIAMGAVLPLLVFFVTNNLDRVCFCITALADLYTSITLIFYPIEWGNHLLASSSGGNTGSSTGAGIGSSTGAGSGSSTGAGVDSSSGNTSIQEAIKENDEAIKATLDKYNKAVSRANRLTSVEIQRSVLETSIEGAKKQIEDKCRELSKTFEETENEIKTMERYFREQFEIEVETQRLLKDSANSPYAKLWEKKIGSPGVLLDLVQKSGAHAIDQLDKDQKTSIYDKCFGAINYEWYHPQMGLTQRLSKHIAYQNVLARIEVEQAALDAINKRNPNESSEQDIETTRANLNLAKLLISNKLAELRGEFNSKERKRWAKHFYSDGNTYYRPQGDEEKTVNWPINHDNDVD